MSRAIKDYNSVDWSKLFTYDPSVTTGLRWKVDRMAGRWMKIYAAKAGDPAGSIHTDLDKNYKACNVPHKGTNWFAARVIWILHKGYLDNEDVIDHIDGNTLNNSIENLRAVKQSVNNKNACKRKDNQTGISGVHFTTASNHKGGVYTYVTTEWYGHEGKKKSKHFSVGKLGLLPAFAEAVKYRVEIINKLRSHGYEYSENHGKNKEQYE